MSEALKDAVGRVAGRTLVVGLGALSYAAVAFCWSCETALRLVVRAPRIGPAPKREGPPSPTAHRRAETV